ncbi:MAG: hypothetical protein U5L01_14090 [Rheinheimera sp.]|nr:hypothetical protein [Rheinheimera sp.]
MSVINQMLRDLDKQQRGEPTVSSRISASHTAKRSKLWWLVVAMLLVIIGQQLLLPGQSTTESARSASMPQTENTVSGEPKILPATDGDVPDPTTTKLVTNNAAEITQAEQPTKVAVKSESSATQDFNSDANNNESAKVVSVDKNAAKITTAMSAQAEEPQELPSGELVVASEQFAVESSTAAEGDSQLNAESSAVSEPEKPVGTAQVQRLSPEQQQQMWQQQAEQALSEGRYEEAEQLLRQWRIVDPHQALPLLAELFWQRQQSLQLDAVLAETRELGVVDIRLARLNLYRLQQQQRWTELLAQINDQLITSYGAEVIALQAQALWQTQQYQPALLAYQQWTSLAPTEARAWLGQALVLEQLAQQQQARMAYQQALQHGGLSPASLQFIQQRLAALPE